MTGTGDFLKAAIRRAANALGYDIVAFDRSSGRWRLLHLFHRHQINLILDVGANSGAFGWDMRELGFSGKIVSFEPLADAYAKLEQASRNDPAWQAVNIGLGDLDEERSLHIASNSQSSSLLPMLDAHKQAAPESAYLGQERVTIHRLETVFADYGVRDDKIFLKIDTQGFERPVLDGAQNILDSAPLVQLECSLVPLYKDVPLAEEMIGYMRELGYDPIDLQPTFHHHDSGHLMQTDILFARR